MKVAEERILHPHQSLKWLRFERDAFRGVRHRHRELELTWIERGVGMRFVGDNVAPFGADDLVLIGVDVPHSWVSDGPRRKNAAAASVIQFPPELFRLSLLPEFIRLGPMAERARLGLAITGACRSAVLGILATMRDADEYRQLAAFVEILGALVTHPADLTAIASTPMRGIDAARGADRIDRVTEWIYRRFAGDLTVHDAARVARISPAAFSRFFGREVGKPFSSYVNDVRCGEACLKLRQSRQPIAAIAAECGFRSIAHFNRQFRRRFGETPRSYRQAMSAS